MLKTVHHVSRLMEWDTPYATRAIIILYQHLMP
jgi:hypothetical protein